MITIALIPDPRYEEEMHSFGLSLAEQPTPTRGCLLDLTRSAQGSRLEEHSREKCLRSPHETKPMVYMEPHMMDGLDEEFRKELNSCICGTTKRCC